PYAGGEGGVDDAGVTGDVDELVIGEAGAALRWLGREQTLAVRLELGRVGGAAGRGRGVGGVSAGLGVRVEKAQWVPDEGDLPGGDELIQGGRHGRLELLAERAEEVEVDLDLDRAVAGRDQAGLGAADVAGAGRDDHRGRLRGPVHG